VLLLIAASFPAGTAVAHHSFTAVYDAAKPVTLTGVVTSVEWTNPHAHFFLDVENEQGTVENWDFELNSPNGLMRLGWTRKSLNTGDIVTVEGFVARDGSRRVNTRTVTRADGTKMFTGEADQGTLR
jgi:DNA/RNA endonuclease YhcR with UshA esterase domain